MNATISTSRVDGREIITERVIDAPRELVFDCWTDPRHVAEWYGPDGFTITTTEMDVRPGGVWRFTMHGPDGTDYPNLITYEEVAPPSRLVHLHGDETEPDLFHVTVTFEERDGATLLLMRALFKSAERLADVVANHGAVEGAQQTVTRLADYVARRRSGAI